METVRELIDRAAADSGERLFLSTPDQADALSYSAFRARADDIARTLLAMSPERKVALAVGPGAPSLEWILGALYGGLVPVPLNPTTAAGQLPQVLMHSGARLVLASGENAELVASAVRQSGWSGRVVPIEDVASLERTDADEGLAPEGDDEQGLLVYTSGTTAQPKGVLHSPERWLQGPVTLAERLGLGAEDRMLCVLPFYHLNAINAAVAVLATRGSIVVCPQFESASFWSQAARAGCTWSSLVPTMLAQLIDRAVESAASASPELRFVRCSSAPLSGDLQQRFEESFGIPVLQGMGMTEAGSTVFQNPPPPGRNKLGSLGTPCGFEVRLLDEEGGVAPRGGTGEIAIRGPSAMTGYYRAPDATRAILDGEGWLRTGERGTCDPDGYYFSVGRSKEIIIKGGTNVAPREIDEALAAHPAVREAACIGAPDRHLGEEIIAFAVLREEPGRPLPSEAELLDACEALVGAFKTPSAIHFVSALPKGPRGKLQRLRLRDLYPHLFELKGGATPGAAPSATSAGETEFVEPRTPLERALARNWSEFLGREVVGIHDDFFAHGGYSLLAVRLFSRLRQELGIPLPLGLCFDHPTIEGQALAILELLQQRLEPVKPTDRGPVPLADREALEAGLLERVRAEGFPRSAAPRSHVAAVLLATVDEASAPLPLFCAYGPSQYRDLALRLAPHRKVYGLFAQREVDLLSGVASSDSDLPRVEDIAALYCEAVQELQPRGPYALGGFSFGGRIALEMARQLQEGGERVGLVVIFDTYMPGTLRWNALRWLRDAVRAVPSRLRRLISRNFSTPRASSGLPSAESEAARDLQAAVEREEQIRVALRARYAPRPYDGPVLLIRALEQRPLRAGYQTDPTLGWDRIAGSGLLVRDVPGRHLTILREPCVEAVSQILIPHLEALESDLPEPR